MIVSYYTPLYRAEADRLRSSLVRLGLDHEIQERPGRGRFPLNVHQRVEVLQDARKARPGEPLLWVDADAVVWEDPGPHLPRGRYDFAYHLFRGEELLGGTLFFAPTLAADQLLSRWRAVNEAKPDRSDQVNLREAVRELGAAIRSDLLPPELCFVFDLSREFYPKAGRPVIEHFQASRRFRERAD